MNDSSGPALVVEAQAAVLTGRISVALITYFYVEDLIFSDVDFSLI